MRQGKEGSFTDTEADQISSISSNPTAYDQGPKHMDILWAWPGTDACKPCECLGEIGIAIA